MTLNLSQFNVLKQVDIASISSDPSAVYVLFKELWQETFNHDHRIVFYTSKKPSDKLLRHIERAAQIIDISEYFILICCPFELTTSLQSIVVDIEDSNTINDGYHIPESICPLPWMHMEVDIFGEYKPCCLYSGDTGKSVRNSTINEALGSELMQTLRKEFITGIKPTGCNLCWKLEDQNLESNRTRHLKFLQKELYTTYFNDLQIRSIDIKSGNVCNFKCRICNPSRSSLVAAEIIKTNPNRLFEIKSILDKTKWPESNPTFFIDLEEALPNLTNINMIGGEPFLVKEFDRIMRLATDGGYANQIRLHYNSNGSIFPTNQVATWSQFKEIDLALSIDNIGSRFELERGGNWLEIENNIKKFLDLKLSNLNIYIMPTVNIQNVYYLPELFEWASALKLPVMCNYLDHPIAFNIDYLTNEFKELIIEKYKNYTHPDLISIANRVKNCKGSDGSMFVAEVSKFDQMRKQSFQITHPEVAKAMGYSI